MTDYTFTSEDMKNLRHKMGLNQTEFGNLLGYTHPQVNVSRVETEAEPVSGRTNILLNQIYQRYTDEQSGHEKSD